MKNIKTLIFFLILSNASFLSAQNCLLACNNLTYVSLDEIGEATIYPTDILEGMYSPECLALFQIALLDSNGDPIIDYAPTLELTCDYVESYTVAVAVVENGMIGNTCWGTISIQDLNDACNFEVAPGNYALNLSSIFNGPFADEIQLNGVALNEVYYKLFEIPEAAVLAGENVITFEGKETLLNGISTLDLVLMQQNLLDIVDRGPLQALIGDVDRSGYLGLNDIIQNRKAILGISQGNNEYIFLKSDYIFPADFDKFDFGTDIYKFHFDGSDAASIDFTFDTYISGDVNLSGNIKGNDESDSREIASLYFIDVELVLGQSYEVEFNLEQTDLAGLQFAMHYENMNEIELISDYNGIELMSHILNNDLKISFLPEETQEDFSFKLRFKSLANGLLSDLISLNEEALKDELVTNAFEIKEIVLSPSSVLNTVNIEALSLKAYPNPSNGNANIVLPENGSYLVNIFDVQGKLISKYTFEGKILTLNEMQFTNTGIYTISMINSNNVYQARIIVQ